MGIPKVHLRLVRLAWRPRNDISCPKAIALGDLPDFSSSPRSRAYNARRPRDRRVGGAQGAGRNGFGTHGRTQMAECPVCGAEVELAADAVVGELMECPDCGAELEVLEVDPPALGEAPETEEDWGQ